MKNPPTNPEAPCVGEVALTVQPAMRVVTGAARAEVTELSWDTEGTGRETANLLRPHTMVELRIRSSGHWRNGIDLPTRVEKDSIGNCSYWIEVAPGSEINWRIQVRGGTLSLLFGGSGTGLGSIEELQVCFP